MSRFLQDTAFLVSLTLVIHRVRHNQHLCRLWDALCGHHLSAPSNNTAWYTADWHAWLAIHPRPVWQHSPHAPDSYPARSQHKTKVQRWPSVGRRWATAVPSSCVCRVLLCLLLLQAAGMRSFFTPFSLVKRRRLLQHHSPAITPPNHHQRLPPGWRNSPQYYKMEQYLSLIGVFSGESSQTILPAFPLIQILSLQDENPLQLLTVKFITHLWLPRGNRYFVWGMGCLLCQMWQR